MVSDDSDSDQSHRSAKSGQKKKRIMTKKKSVKEKKGTKEKKNNDRYVLNSAIKEDHGDHIFSVTFDPFIPPDRNQVFATVAKNGVRIYECRPDRTIPLNCFEDPDKTENFYTSAWGIINKEPVLAFAGLNGSIRIINIANQLVCRHLIGHGSSINELQFHPRHRTLLASASKDLTLKIWDVFAEIQVFICGGLYGHRDEVLSCEFKQTGDFIASCGMDHQIMIWNLDSDRARLAIKAAEVFQLHHSKTPFPTVTLSPIYVTGDIHSNYIDCVRWYGDFIFSKSCENEIKCWEPDLSKPSEINPSPPVTAMMPIEIPNCPNWYVRFGLDKYQQFMAAGNASGQIFVWDLETFEKCPKMKPLNLSHPKRHSQCRQCSFSNNGDILVGVFDDSSVWRYDFQQRPKVENGASNGIHIPEVPNGNHAFDPTIGLHLSGAPIMSLKTEEKPLVNGTDAYLPEKMEETGISNDKENWTEPKTEPHSST